MPTSSAAPSATPDEPVPANKKAQVIQGTSAGGARALGTQVAAFYFRAPIKAFFRMRVDYMVSEEPVRGSRGLHADATVPVASSPRH